MNSWIVFGLVAFPVIAVVLWLLLDESIVRIEPGQLGLLLVHGKATDQAFGPGIHFVPAFRRRTVVPYPSLELALRCGGDTVDDDAHELERSTPPIGVVLGDRADASVSYTVRFAIDPSRLQLVHDRFGGAGIWSAVRDTSARSVRSVLADDSTSLDDLVGPRRTAIGERVADAVARDLATIGFAASSVAITHVDLGRAGDAIQAAVRARFELEREEAETGMRQARARADAQVAALLADVAADPALRYRESDAWRDLVAELARRPGAVPVSGRPTVRRADPAPEQAADDESAP